VITISGFHCNTILSFRISLKLRHMLPSIAFFSSNVISPRQLGQSIS
jgi:hypothetical protein